MYELHVRQAVNFQARASPAHRTRGLGIAAARPRSARGPRPLPPPLLKAPCSGPFTRRQALFEMPPSLPAAHGDGRSGAPIHGARADVSAWHGAVKPALFRVAAVACAALSLVIVWCEGTILLDGEPFNLNLSPLSYLFKSMGAGGGGAGAVVALFVPLLYCSACTYFSMFRMRLCEGMTLYPHQHSDGSALLFNATYACRLGPPLCFNYLKLLHEGTRGLYAHRGAHRGISTYFSQTTFGEMDQIPLFQDDYFNNYAPLLIVLLCGCTYLNFGSGLLSCCSKCFPCPPSPSTRTSQTRASTTARRSSATRSRTSLRACRSAPTCSSSRARRRTRRTARAAAACARRRAGSTGCRTTRSDRPRAQDATPTSPVRSPSRTDRRGPPLARIAAADAPRLPLRADRCVRTYPHATRAEFILALALRSDARAALTQRDASRATPTENGPALRRPAGPAESRSQTERDRESAETHDTLDQ
jgi:hypothetical protein